MANQKHLKVIKQGTDPWNAWRIKHPNVLPDLSGADLSGADLSNSDLCGADLCGADFRDAKLCNTKLQSADLSNTDLYVADLSGANLYDANLSDAILGFVDLRGANLLMANLTKANLRSANLGEAQLNTTNLTKANLFRANLTKADLSGAFLMDANLRDANLFGANLRDANLFGANLSKANLTDVDLTAADLSRTILIATNLTNTKLKDCNIYGISAWDVLLDGAKQYNLTITPEGQPTITVDNLKIAQFIYLLLDNAEIRDVINTLTTKSVLILGRFTPERKAVLDAIRDALRKHNYLPILFDFYQPSTQTVRETVRTLAHLSHFVIADLSEPSSVPLELETIIPTLPIAVQPILAATEKMEFSMFSSLSTRYHWLLPIYRYTDLDSLLVTLKEKVLTPVEQKAQELNKK